MEACQRILDRMNIVPAFSTVEDRRVYTDVVSNTVDYIKTVSPDLYKPAVSKAKLYNILESNTDGVKDYIDRIILYLGNNDRSLLDNLNSTEKLYIIEILRELSDSGYSQILSNLREVDYITEPVSPEEFLLSKEYIGDIGQNLYEKLRPDFYKICGSKEIVEVILSGSIGWGKSFSSVLLLSWVLYALSCLRNPHKFYNISENTPIVLMNLSVRAGNSYSVIFSELKALVDATTYFKKVYVRNKKINDSLVFPNKVIFTPGGSTEASALGQNLFAVVIDEMNFMDKIHGSSRSVDATGVYDQAKQIYNATSRRMKSRFMKKGKIPGKALLISSKRYPGDFLERHIEETKGDPAVYVIDKNAWELKPEGTYGAERFYLEVGDRTKNSVIFRTKEDLEKYRVEMKGNVGRVIEIPMEYYRDFELDIEGCFSEDTKVKSLDGNSYSFRELVDNSIKELWVYSYDETVGEVVPKLAHNISKRFTEVPMVEVELDTGERVKCTLDHKWMMRDGAYKEAQHLLPGDSLMPLYVRVSDKKDEFLEEISLINHKVVSVKFLDEKSDAYCLTVDGTNNFALDCGVFVHNSLRDTAGISTYSTNPFISDRSRIYTCSSDVSRLSLFNKWYTNFEDGFMFLYDSMLESYIEAGVVKKKLRYFPDSQRFIGIDLSKSSDRTGFCMGCLAGHKKIQTVDPLGKVINIYKPIIFIDCVLKIYPDSTGEINYQKLTEFVEQVANAGYPIAQFGFDQYNSVYHSQIFKSKGYEVVYLSVDRTSEPYDALKNSVLEMRINIPKCEDISTGGSLIARGVQTELMELEKSPLGKAPDHPTNGSKDSADALASVVKQIVDIYEPPSSFDRVMTYSDDPTQEIQDMVMTATDPFAVPEALMRLHEDDADEFKGDTFTTWLDKL